jgi:hypothetical protein
MSDQLSCSTKRAWAEAEILAEINKSCLEAEQPRLDFVRIF